MALLDTLVIAFQSDTKDLKKGVDEVDDALTDAKKTVEETDQATANLGDQFKRTLIDAAGTITALYSIGQAVQLIMSQAAETESLGNFSNALGINIEDVAAWGKAVEEQGGSAADFQGSLKGLTDSLTELSLTGGGPASETLARLGIQAVDSGGKVKSAFAILPEIADQFQRLSKTESLALGQQLGLDQATILLLQQGRRAIDEQIKKQKELGVPTKENYETAKQFQTAFRNLTTVFQDVTRDIGSAVLPAFTSILKGVQAIVKFFRENEAFAVGFFTSLGIAVGVYAVSTAAAAIATNTLLLPILAVGAAVAATAVGMGLFWSEIQAFSSGAPSLIGNIRDFFVESFEKMAESVAELWNEVKAFFGSIADLIPENKFSGIKSAIDPKNAFTSFQRICFLAYRQSLGERQTQPHRPWGAHRAIPLLLLPLLHWPELPRPIRKTQPSMSMRSMWMHADLTPKRSAKT